MALRGRLGVKQTNTLSILTAVVQKIPLQDFPIETQLTAITGLFQVSAYTTSISEKSRRMGEKPDVTKFDYLQCSIPDIHGVPRGRVVPRHLIPRVLRDGFGLFQGIGNFGMNMEIPYDIEEYASTHYANGIIMPLPDTAFEMKWSSTPKRRIGHAISSLLFSNGEQDPVCSRHTAQRQIDRLKKMGMKIKSAYEMEFMVFESEDASKPMGGGKKQYGNMELLDENLDFFLDLMDTLRDSGLPVEFFNNEFDEGQYEITMEPRTGIEAADAVFLARYGIRAFSRRRGYNSTFMARPAYPQNANGFHLNHSLWTKDGKDVFFDEADPQRLSVFARQWIAGLLHHTPGLCALFSPTVNCYQRFSSGLAPNTVYWNIDDRTCTFRAKTSSTGAYLENRLPSSACNPYLTLSATIAAGLDGVERKLECPQPGPPKEGEKAGPVIPKTLDEALDCLNKDTVLKEAVGAKVVDYFTLLKRQFEIKHFENNATPDMSKAERIEIERKYYMPYL
ncbi:hypothetical protein V1264_023670 [Littorina saxatilis]|uniref:Lengsin n=3 Tax=Littorina saxatilis TaxID=31220 RepID=A0AAN9G9N3_9CAEN